MITRGGFLSSLEQHDIAGHWLVWLEKSPQSVTYYFTLFTDVFFHFSNVICIDEMVSLILHAHNKQPLGGVFQLIQLY